MRPGMRPSSRCASSTADQVISNSNLGLLSYPLVYLPVIHAVTLLGFPTLHIVHTVVQIQYSKSQIVLHPNPVHQKTGNVK